MAWKFNYRKGYFTIFHCSKGRFNIKNYGKIPFNNLVKYFSNREPTLTIVYFLCALVDILPILLIYCWSVKNSRNTVLLLKEKTKSSNWFCADLSIHTTTKVLIVCNAVCTVCIRHHSGTKLLFITASNNWLHTGLSKDV